MLYTFFSVDEQPTILLHAQSAFLDGMRNSVFYLDISWTRTDADAHYRSLFWLVNVFLSARHLKESTSQQNL